MLRVIGGADVTSTKPGLNPYLSLTAGGLLRTDAKMIKAGQNLDGKADLGLSTWRAACAPGSCTSSVEEAEKVLEGVL
jgi:hypothetical protein